VPCRFGPQKEFAKLMTTLQQDDWLVCAVVVVVVGAGGFHEWMIVSAQLRRNNAYCAAP
jgi:hypothetical protein